MTSKRMFDVLGRLQMEQRSKYHLTYGGLIDACKQAPLGTRLAGGYVGISSYRGYYEDIAICHNYAQRKFPVLDCHALASWLRAQLGGTLYGYKGGDFVINEACPLWIATDSGDCSNLAVVDFTLADGYLVLQTKTV